MKTLYLILSVLFLAFVSAQEYYDEEENEDVDDIMKLGGGTQQTCDGCRTVMETLLHQWRDLDVEFYKEAENKALEIGEYVPMYPNDPEERKIFKAKVVKRFQQSCSDASIWVQYKGYIKKTCETITKEHGNDIVDIIVDKNDQLDTEIVNYLTRVVCMGYASLCNIKYLNVDTTNVSGRCGYCVNIARLLEYRTRRASVKYINRGLFFDSMLESFCEDIPTFYSHPSQIGLVCEELLDEFDEEIPKLLRTLSEEPKSIQFTKVLCKDKAKLCSAKQIKQIENYDYRNALGDFQRSQNFKQMNINDPELKEKLSKENINFPTDKESQENDDYEL